MFDEFFAAWLLFHVYIYLCNTELESVRVRGDYLGENFRHWVDTEIADHLRYDSLSAFESSATGGHY